MEQAEQFLHEMWDAAPNDRYFLIWTMPDKRSRWFRTTESGISSALELVERIRGRCDVYVGAALAAKSYGSRQRMVAADAVGLVGLWADVDFMAAGAHKKQNLPPDADAASELLAGALVPPTLVVHSGNGLQGWWLFDEPMMFANREEQAAASQLSQKWNYALREVARRSGWDVDATWNLDRVMRLPGTENQKSSPAKPVVLDLDGGPRYRVRELRELVGAEEKVTPTQMRQLTEKDFGFELSGNAQPPFEKWEALRQADRGVEKAWQRKKLRMADQSPSAYDMALANYAAMADWTDQEIVDLLVSHRRQYNDDLKLDRPDYYARTIRKARDTTQREKAPEQVDEVVEAMEFAQTDEERDAAREELADWLSQALRVGITRIERFSSDPAIFRMQTENGWVVLGTSDDLFKQPKLRAAIVDVSRSMPPRFKPAEYDKIVEAIVRAAVTVDLGPEATMVGSVDTWLTDYLEQNDPAAEDEWDDSTIVARAPFMQDGRIHIFSKAFQTFIERFDGERLGSRELAHRLKMYGAEPTKINLSIGKKRTSRSVWRLPKEVGE